MDDTNIPVRHEMPDHEECRALADILMCIGDKWTVMVVGALSQGALRYSEIDRLVGTISQRMLTLTLKQLERDGMVTRTVFATIPPRVDYALTECGRTLIVPLNGLWVWAQANKEAIEQSRRDFDDARSRPDSNVHTAHKPV